MYNTKQDIINTLPKSIPFLKALLDEHKIWKDGVYESYPTAPLFQMGFTVDEALALIPDYVEPPIPPAPPTPEEQAAAELIVWRNSTSCGPLQFRRALRSAGLMDSVKAVLETAPEEVIEAWEYATVVYRSDPMIVSFGIALGKTDEELDDLFKLALTFK